MGVYDRLKGLFGTAPKTHTGTFFPHYLRPYGTLKNSIQGVYGHMTGKKPLIEPNRTAEMGNYYLRTSGVVTAFIREMQNNSVGSALGTLQSKITAFDPETNQKLNSFIESEWEKFTEDPNEFDLSGRWDLQEFLSMAVSNLLVEGELNVRIFNNIGAYNNRYQLLDFASVDYYRLNRNIFHGVEIDGFTRPVAYWIVDSNEAKYRVPAEEFIHFANSLAITEYRGTSYLNPAFDILDKINSFESATVNAAINEATKVIYYKSDSSYMKAYEGAASAADLSNWNPNAVNDQAPSPAYDPSQILSGSGVTSGGIAIEALPAGVDMGQLQSNHPGGSFVEADKHLYRILGGALGLPMSSLLLDLSESNYSSMQAGELLKRPVFRKMSRLLISKILEPVYKNFMTTLVAKNPQVFTGPLESYCAPTWPLPKFPYVNPVDGVNADVLALTNDLRLWSDLLSDYGWDLEDYLARKAADEAMIASSGTTLRTKNDKDLQLEYFTVNAGKAAKTPAVPKKGK